MDEAIDARRRRLFGTVAMTLACAELEMLGTAQAQPAAGTAPSSGADGFHTIRQIDAGVLNIGYAELGPAGGQAVVLLHGWPYDIHSYAQVAPALAARGYRVIVPFLRGYGSTRFRSPGTPRNGIPQSVSKCPRSRFPSWRTSPARSWRRLVRWARRSRRPSWSSSVRMAMASG
jgi:hypothetical protein